MPWHLPAPLMAYECCYGNTASSYPERLCMAHSTVRYHNTLKRSYVVSSVTSSKLFHRFCCARVFVWVCSACLHTCVMLFPSQQNASIHKSTEAYFDLAVFSFRFQKLLIPTQCTYFEIIFRMASNRDYEDTGMRLLEGCIRLSGLPAVSSPSSLSLSG